MKKFPFLEPIKDSFERQLDSHFTRLDHACKQGDLVRIQSLLALRQKSPGELPLHIACRENFCSYKRYHRTIHTRVVAVLLASGADPNAKTAGGDTPLHLAATHRNPDLITTLLTAGADPNATNAKGHSPLTVAHHYYWQKPRMMWERRAQVNCHLRRAVLCALIQGGADSTSLLPFYPFLADASATPPERRFFFRWDLVRLTAPEWDALLRRRRPAPEIMDEFLRNPTLPHHWRDSFLLASCGAGD